MPYFTYKAINEEGKIVRGLIEERDIELAHDNISSLGLHVLNIRRSNKLTSFYLKRFKSWGINTRDIIEFATNLSVMLRAGLPLVLSLSGISETMENKRFKERILDIKRRIELGSNFSSALSFHQDIFPDMFINLVAVGEETGRLDQSLTDIATHLQRMEDLKSAIKRALLYPIFAIIATTGALLFWIIYVLPKISELFISMGIKLPAITRALLAASDFARGYWYTFLFIPIVIFGIFKLLSKREATKYYIDRTKLKIPIIKLIVFNRLLVLFTEQLRILIAAGVTIDRAFDIIIKVVNNVVYKRALTEIKEDILIGSRINEAVKKHEPLFPNLVVRMIHVGEEAGNLVEQLDYLSEYFLKKLDDISQKIGKMIEPIVIAVIGVMFLIIIIGVLSPIYDLISKIGR